MWLNVAAPSLSYRGSAGARADRGSCSAARLAQISLVALCTSQDIKTYSWGSVLERLVRELKLPRDTGIGFSTLEVNSRVAHI